MTSILKNTSWRSLRVWQRNFDVYLATWKVNFIPPVLEPILYLLAFGLGLGQLVKDVPYNSHQISYLEFIAPGLIATAIMNHGFFETTYASFVRMYYQKTFDAIMSTPLTIEDVVFGEILWGATKSLFAGTIMLVVMFFFGLLSFPLSLWILPISFITGMTFASMGMCFTAIVKNIEMFNFPVFLFITPMFLFSGVFFPLSTLPIWAQYVAWFLPLTFLVSSVRAIGLGSFGMDIFLQLLVLIVLAFICTLLSLSMMKKRLLK
ncbi:MAG: ABC transporter permease [Elusimicrobia bacterium RIFOXYD2_FULL_34_15]|nr:MAG: ABC transporter permease [Elusimicrobia bacterium RIFOXYD2_FULL_34_15]